MTTKTHTPQAPRWVICSKALPQKQSPAPYEITIDDDVKTLIIKDRQRQMIDALLIGPVFCASTVRFSDLVLLLRRRGFLIDTLKNDEGRDYYKLACAVTQIGGGV